MSNDSLEILANTQPKKFIANIREANKRIAEVEAERDAQIRVVELLTNRQSASADTATPEIVPVKTGRARWGACSIEGQAATPLANTAPIKKDGAKLTGRERFAASFKHS
jgi:hypothetical protein